MSIFQIAKGQSQSQSAVSHTLRSTYGRGCQWMTACITINWLAKGHDVFHYRVFLRQSGDAVVIRLCECWGYFWLSVLL